MRSIGMDVHRSFAQVAIHEDGVTAKSFRIDLEHEAVVAFGASLRPDDEVVLEGEADQRSVRWTLRPPNGNTAAIVRLLKPLVGRVVIANPLQVKAIVHARVKTDKVDAAILAQLHAAGFLPEVWAADDETLALRRLVSERVAVVRSIRRAKSRVHAVLHANLIPKYEGHLFGKGGRRWLAKAPLPRSERDLLARHLDLACCRFRGHDDKIVTLGLEDGDEADVQPRVQARGGEVGGGAWGSGGAGVPRPGRGRECAAALDAGTGAGAIGRVPWPWAGAFRPSGDRGASEGGRPSQGGA